MQCWEREIINKRILFITTKNIDYIRNVQEIGLMKRHARELKLIYSDKKCFLFRILEVYFKLFFFNINKIDIVFVGFSPQMILPIFYRKLKKKIIIIDFFISVYDTLINDRKKIRSTSLAAKWCYLIDKKTIRESDHIISDTRAHAKYFQKEFGAEKEKVETLYLKADTTIFFSRNMTRPKQLEKKFIVLYFGSILPLQGVEVILAALDRLKERNEFYFYIIGNIGNKYKKPLSKNIEYIKWVDQEKLAEYISMADLCLAGHFNSEIEKAKRTIPGKAYIYEAMEKVMVLGENEANREVFKDDSRHYFVKMGNVGALENVIMERWASREGKEA